jgi:kinesin family member C1
MAFSQSTTSRPVSSLPKSRPATSMENHSSDEDIPANGKRKGMQPESSIHSFTQSQEFSTLLNRKLRAQQSMHAVKSQSEVNNRDVSVSTAFSRLRIDEQNQGFQQGHQAISTKMKPPRTNALSHKPSLTNGMRKLRTDSTENALVLFQASGDSLVAPKTQSHIPVLSKAEASNVTPVTPCRPPTISPTKTSFLSKDSNIVGFTAWDVRGRLEDMEAMYSELKDTLQGTNLERNGLEEAQALYKQRSKCPCTMYH